MSDPLVIASLYPVILGTYGDGGNTITLRHRAQLRGIETTVIDVQPGVAIPQQADIYVMGGGEDTAQVAACEEIRADGGLVAAADRGAPILAICAGYQLLGEAYPNAKGEPSKGLGILDMTTTRLPERAVGELAAEASGTSDLRLTQRLTGYENHAGKTTLGAGVSPLGRTLAGVGNGDGTEGAISGHTVGTYLHGPCLVRNPQIADRMLEWAVGHELDPIDDSEVIALREERLATVLGGQRHL